MKKKKKMKILEYQSKERSEELWLMDKMSLTMILMLNRIKRRQRRLLPTSKKLTNHSLTNTSQS
jgi:hypothetical protein